jgi:hypothetical protein
MSTDFWRSINIPELVREWQRVFREDRRYDFKNDSISDYGEVEVDGRLTWDWATETFVNHLRWRLNGIRSEFQEALLEAASSSKGREEQISTYRLMKVWLEAQRDEVDSQLEPAYAHAVNAELALWRESVESFAAAANRNTEFTETRVKTSQGDGRHFAQNSGLKAHVLELWTSVSVEQPSASRKKRYQDFESRYSDWVSLYENAPSRPPSIRTLEEWSGKARRRK